MSGRNEYRCNDASVPRALDDCAAVGTSAGFEFNGARSTCEPSDQTVGQVAADAREALRHDIDEALSPSAEAPRSPRWLVVLAVAAAMLVVAAIFVAGFSAGTSRNAGDAAGRDGADSAAPSESAEGGQTGDADSAGAAGQAAEQDILVGHWGVTAYFSEDGEASETNPETFYADFNADSTASITSAETTVFYTWHFAIEGEDSNGHTRSYALKQTDGTGEELFVTIGADEGSSTYGLGVIASSEADHSETLGIAKS